MKATAALDGLMGALRDIERNVLVKHREKYHPLVWLERAEACGLITKEQAAPTCRASRSRIRRNQDLPLHPWLGRLTMKPRRVIITIEAETDLPLATLRNIESIELVGIDGFPDYLFAHDGDGSRIVQVQVNAIKPEPKPTDLIDTTQDGPHPAVSGGKRIRSMKATHIPRAKAKRAKGAK